MRRQFIAGQSSYIEIGTLLITGVLPGPAKKEYEQTLVSQLNQVPGIQSYNKISVFLPGK